VGLNSFQTSGNSPGGERCRVGIFGFGGVGAAIARRLTGEDPVSGLELTHICDRRAREKRARQPDSSGASASSPISWTDRFDDLLASDVDIVVEALTGTEPAIDYVRAALLAGKSVVTVNKEVVAQQGSALLTLAERQGRQLRYEAAVGGAMPIVRLLGEGLAGDRIVKIEAILNGTSNSVLSRMEELGCDMDEAVADACARGYAELNPATDLDGHDAAAKLSILCALGFGLRVLPTEIETRTTTGIAIPEFREARMRGATIRQIAHARFDRAADTLTVWVSPQQVPLTSLFGRTTGPGNAAVMTSAMAGEVSLTGVGAGGDAKAVSAVADLVTIARDRAAIVPAPVLAAPAIIKGFSDQTLAEAV
jgi:homoserine dehydrogenase